MELTDAQSVARFKAMAELHALGVAIEREKIREANPTLSDEDVRRRLRAWLGYEGFDDPGDPHLVARPPRPIPVPRG